MNSARYHATPHVIHKRATARVTKALPALQICNDTVTITDTFSSTPNASESTSVEPIGAGAVTNVSATYVVTGAVIGPGAVSNTAELTGIGSTVTLTIDPLLGTQVQLPCCSSLDLTATSSVNVDAPAPATYCSYRRQQFLHN